MNRHTLSFFALMLLLAANQAWACSVCFGDPQSDMSRGVRWGVLFLGGVIVFVLAAIGSISVSWARRARKLNPAED